MRERRRKRHCNKRSSACSLGGETMLGCELCKQPASLLVLRAASCSRTPSIQPQKRQKARAGVFESASSCGPSVHDAPIHNSTRRIVLGRFSLCAARARATEIQRAACAVYDEHSRWPHSWRASRRILSHCTSDSGGRARCPECKLYITHFLLVLQDELQSDTLDAALEETKAKVEKYSK